MVHCRCHIRFDIFPEVVVCVDDKATILSKKVLRKIRFGVTESISIPYVLTVSKFAELMEIV